MKKTILITIASLSFLNATTLVELEKTIKSMQSQIDTLKEIKVQNQIDEISTILEEAEHKTFLDKVNISPELRIRTDKFTYSDAHPAYTKDVSPEPLVSTRIRLNMKTEFNQGVRFYARTISSISTQSNERICTLSPQTSGVVSNNGDTSMTTEFDRAYFDYYINPSSQIPFIFSAGILPTTGGGSSNLIENTPRKSVFPSIIFDSNMIGLILSANLSKITGLDDAYIRFIVGEAYTLNPKHFYYQCNRENIGHLEDIGLYFETNLPNIGKKALLVMGVNYAKNIKATPFLGNLSLSNKTTIEKETIMDEHLANFVPEQQNILGNVLNASIGLEIQGIAKSNTDLFFHTAISEPKPNGNTVDFSGQEGVYNTGDYVQGSLIDSNGYAAYIGLRQHFPSLNSAMLGIEYNYGSQYWWSVTQGSEDIFNKLANRGSTYEIYYNQPFNRYVNLGLGYMQVNEQYAGSGWHFAKDGTPIEKDATQKNLYIILNSYF